MSLLNSLRQSGHISAEDADRIATAAAQRPFSLHWELKSMLYFGVLLMNVGLGVLVYQHIDTIGHAVLIAAIGAVSTGCFWYAWRHHRPFSLGEVESPTHFFDYVVLFGCLTFLIMEGYWQYQYHIFGERYGLALLFPTVIFFFVAYYFDHRGVLSLAITSMAAWLGITITPYELLSKNDFNSERIVLTGVGLGLLFTVIPFISERLHLKKHFSLTYLNFAIHLLMISCLAGMMPMDKEILYFPLLCIAAGFYLWYARQSASFYFLTVSIIYAYIGLTCLIFKHAGSGWAFEGYLLYLVLTCGGIIAFLLNYKKFFQP